MTPVQAQTIPRFLNFKDVAVQAPTGSGKTLAFIVPAIEMILRRERPLRKDQVGCLIISPTRELAEQIHQVAARFAKHIPQITELVTYGGTNVEEDMATMRGRGATIITGTPGRLEDLLNRMADFNTSELEVLILDEADRILDMGFQVSVSHILQRLPRQRRTGLFSATQTKQVRQLMKVGLRNPIKIDITVKSNDALLGTQMIPTSLDNTYVYVPSHKKLGCLLQILDENRGQKIVVFFLTRKMVDYFHLIFRKVPELRQRYKDVISVHGGVPTEKRLTIQKQMHDADNGIVLLCTDVYARGLDFPAVDVIIQYDPPLQPDVFVHRIGRTARAGNSGKAILFLLPSEKLYVDFLGVRQIPIRESTDRDFSTFENYIPQIKEFCAAKREMFSLSITAFLSYMRGYKEHVCKYIFTHANLNLTELCESFALVHVPSLLEIPRENIDYEDTVADPDVIPWSDNKREAVRLSQLRELKKREKQRKAEIKKKMERNKKFRKRKAEEKAAAMDILEEWKCLQALKKRKITEEEYEILTGETVERPKKEKKDDKSQGPEYGPALPTIHDLERQEREENDEEQPKKRRKKKKRRKRVQRIVR